MTKPVRSLILVLTVAPFLAGAAEATARKCVAPGKPIPVLIIDWVVIGDLHPMNSSAAAAADAGSDAANRVFAALPPADIEAIAITCFDLVEDGVVVRRSVISVFTKSGSRSLLTRYLDDLAARQEDYRERNGKYAGSLAELGLSNTGPPIQENRSVFVNSKPPIQTFFAAATETGWRARAWVDGTSTKCEVSFGSGLPGTGEPENEVVTCFATRE